MKDQNIPKQSIVPAQKKGNQSSASAHVDTKQVQEAVSLFRSAKLRLMDVNNWNKISGMASADFQLMDAEGKTIQRFPEAGDLIRIDLPGPGPREGHGYDWVRIEAITEQHDKEHDRDLFAFRVRPVKAPGSTENTSAHFYTGDATSSFILERTGTKITASEEGRNEVPNTETGHPLDEVRNAVVAFTASKGFAYPQWKSLMEGILERPE